MDDSQLIQQYAASRCDDAFKALVDQYVGLVFSACLRQLKDSHLAEDATQAVFLLLSQKAGTLRQGHLPGWLLTTSRYACANIRKSQLRRKQREQHVAMSQTMQTPTRQSDLPDLLDEALTHLRPGDRDALVLCYLNEQPLNEVAQALGISQNAARKRVDRGVEKLRQYFSRRGITTTSGALSALLAEQLCGAVLAPAARQAITHGILQVCHVGPHGAAACVAIAKGTNTMMMLTKLKSAVLLAMIITAVGTTGWMISQTLANSASAPQAAAQAPAVPLISAPQPANTLPAGNFLGKLANGVSIEVVGVGENPSGTRPWWQADGSPLTIPKLPEFDYRAETPVPDMLLRQLIVHLDPPQDHPEEGWHVRWNVVGSTNRHVHIPGDAPSPSLGLDGAVFCLPDDPAGCTVRAVVAAGDWHTQFTASGAGGQSDSHASSPGLPDQSFSCANPVSANGITKLACTYSGFAKDEEVRLVAIDDAGREHLARTRTIVVLGGTSQCQFSYDLPAPSIRQWKLQSRAFDQWIEIRHVAIQPGQKLQPQIATSDGEAPAAGAHPIATPATRPSPATQPSLPAPQTSAPQIAHVQFRWEVDHFAGSGGKLFHQTPAMKLAPVAAIKSGAWRDDIHPALLWAGDMTDEGAPNAALELEIYPGGWGILRTEYGWYPVTHFTSSASLMNFDLDAANRVGPGALDEKIVQRSAEILSTESVWNRADDRHCPPDAKTWSIYCAMEKASLEITGGFHHRRPALEVVRQIVDQRTRSRNYQHRLMDYNNDPTTHLADVQSLFKEALTRIQKQ